MLLRYLELVFIYVDPLTCVGNAGEERASGSKTWWYRTMTTTTTSFTCWGPLVHS